MNRWPYMEEVRKYKSLSVKADSDLFKLEFLPESAIIRKFREYSDFKGEIA